MKNFVRGIMVCVALLGATSAWAENAAAGKKESVQAKDGAHAVVGQVTDKLMAVVSKEKALLESNPQAYYSKVKAVLEPVVDFEYIARNVMGGHWKSATPQQRKRFVETFKNSLVETYAKGMANYTDLKIRVLPSSEDTKNDRRVGVVQEITGPDGVNRVSYTMALHRDGDWRLINMVLNGVNLGKTFRNQFAQAVKQYDGNLDAAISNWSAEA